MILVNKRGIVIQGRHRVAAFATMYKTYLVYEGDVNVFTCQAIDEEDAERQYKERFGVIGEASIFIQEVKA